MQLSQSEKAAVEQAAQRTQAKLEGEVQRLQDQIKELDQSARYLTHPRQSCCEGPGSAGLRKTNITVLLKQLWGTLITQQLDNSQMLVVCWPSSSSMIKEASSMQYLTPLPRQGM